MPSMRKLVLNNITERISYHSNKDEKNGPSDVDIDLYSLHEFFKNIKKGNTNMHDMIYGYSNEDAVLYDGYKFNKIYDNRDKLVNKGMINNNFLGYAYGQYKKYYEKNKRLEVLKNIKEYFNRQIQYNDKEKLSDYYQDMKKYLLNNIGSFVEEVVNKDIRENDLLERYEINNRNFHINTPIYKFLESINSQIDKYGDRVEGDKIDYKSIYHSYRMIFISKLLAKEGQVSLPFDKEKTEFLKNIKEGKIDCNNINIEEEINNVRELVNESNKVNEYIDEGFIDHMILDFYGYV